jgi:PAS domain S-box-containing protein
MKTSSAAELPEGFYQSLIANTTYVIQLLNRYGRILYDSPAVTTMLGYESSDRIGKRILLFVHPDDRRTVFETLQRLNSGEKPSIENIEIRLLHRNGNWIWVNGTATRVNDGPSAGGIFINYHDITLEKIKTEQIGELNGMLHLRASELAESNAELERFAFVASHDLQEPLRMITGFMNLLKKQHSAKLDADAQQYIGFAVEGAERMKKMITDLLEYSRVGTTKEEPGPVDLNILMAEVTNLFSKTISETGATLETGFLPVIKGKKTQLLQLFQNLTSNALKYRSRETPRISISCRKENGFWKFEFRDNGIGIDPKFSEKIFVIFQRLHNKSQYSGTGIGLAICKKIVEQHGGKIWIEPNEGQGTIFCFTVNED